MNKPIDTIKEGNVSVSIWENPRINKETKQEFKVLSTSMQRTVYDETTKEYKHYNSFSMADIPKLIKCLQEVNEKYNKTNGWKELKL